MKAVCCVILQLALLAGLCAAHSAHEGTAGAEEAFIGWQGETYVPPKEPKDKSKPWVQIVSWKPRAFVFHNFMTDDEAEHIKRLAAPTMKRSTVVGPDGKSVEDDYRTSYGTFVKRRQDEVLARVEARVASWVQIPEDHAEDMQVLRYSYLQTYKPHMDTLDDSDFGPRVATVLLYLSDVEEGGETAFPDSKVWVHPDLPEKMGPFSACTKGGVAFKPKKGDAFLFWSMQPDAKQEDPASMHTGCPVLKGVKWTATKWIHAKPFRPTTFGLAVPEPDPGLCVDNSEGCESWAKSGQCEKNKGFMVGSGDSLGSCRKSCGACTPCGKGDLACYNANRRELGYLEVEDFERGLFPAVADIEAAAAAGAAKS